MKINASDIKRHGRTILLGQGYTATEGYEGNLPTLSIRKDGKHIKFYRGNSLVFAEKLTAEDKKYLAALVDLNEKE